MCNVIFDTLSQHIVGDGDRSVVPSFMSVCQVVSEEFNLRHREN